MDKQYGCCPICEKSLDHLGESYHIDHDHKTGEVRGLLCSHCNKGIGSLMDNPDYMRRGASYIEGDLI